MCIFHFLKIFHITNISKEKKGTVKITKEVSPDLEQVMCTNLPTGLKYSIDVSIANFSLDVTITEHKNNKEDIK